MISKCFDILFKKEIAYGLIPMNACAIEPLAVSIGKMVSYSRDGFS